MNKPQPPELYFLRTYPFRYDSSHHHSKEKDYFNPLVILDLSLTVTAPLLRVYPTTFNQFDAYLELLEPYQIQLVESLGRTWKVVAGPTRSPENGYFRCDYSNNNPTVYMYGLLNADHN